MEAVPRERQGERTGSNGRPPSRWHNDDRPPFRWDLLFLALLVFELVAIAILAGPWR